MTSLDTLVPAILPPHPANRHGCHVAELAAWAANNEPCPPLMAGFFMRGRMDALRQLHGTHSSPMSSQENAMPSARVVFRFDDVASAGDSDFTADVLTNGRTAPQATLADNSGFPAVRDLYARAMRVSGGIGMFDVVRVVIRFESGIAASADAIAVNIYQEDASEFSFPWISVVSDQMHAGNPAA